MSDLRKTVLNPRPTKVNMGRGPTDFTPLPAKNYFNDEIQITTDNGTFNVFKLGTSGPLLCCLHGGGYSGLTWALFAVEICKNIQCQVAAIDLRGHGKTFTNNDADLSLEALSQDVCDVILKITEGTDTPVILVGHSMGGAVAVETARLLGNIGALCVIDVVEGTALEALSSMHNILRGRPSSFKSIEHAIQWYYKSGQTRNPEAARISMPGQIVEKVHESSQNSLAEVGNSSVIQEEEEEEEETSNDNVTFSKPSLPKPPRIPVGISNKESQVKDNKSYVWRIDLHKTEKFWKGWFLGLSQKFLDVLAPKILLLANIHGLDTSLTIGQMQGKFHFQVLTKSGHAVHEDQPEQVAEIISIYLVKHKQIGRAHV